MAIKIKTSNSNRRRRYFYSDKNVFIMKPGGTTLHKQIPCLGPTKERYIETDIEIPANTEKTNQK